MNKKYVCQINVINERKVRAVRRKMLNDDVFANLSEIFRTLGDKTRVKILYALSKKELCVCDISGVLGMSISAISHQLRVLRNMKLVKYRKKGREVYYSLDDEHIIQLIEISYRHAMEERNQPGER